MESRFHLGLQCETIPATETDGAAVISCASQSICMFEHLHKKGGLNPVQFSSIQFNPLSIATKRTPK